MAETFAHFDLGAMSKADGYKLLASVICRGRLPGWCREMRRGY